jgi:hypothetical protein
MTTTKAVEDLEPAVTSNRIGTGPSRILLTVQLDSVGMLLKVSDPGRRRL